jgi:hypothetical protein
MFSSPRNHSAVYCIRMRLLQNLNNRATVALLLQTVRSPDQVSSLTELRRQSARPATAAGAALRLRSHDIAFRV